MSDIQNKALYIYFQLRKAIDISNSQVAQKLIISRSTKEIPTKNSTIYYSIQVTITQLMDRAKRNLEILFSPWYSSSFFFFSKPTAFSFIGGNSWSQRICLEAPHYRTLHIEKASSMYSSTALNTFNYLFRGSPLSHLNSVCTVAHNRSLLISLVIHSILQLEIVENYSINTYLNI